MLLILLRYCIYKEVMVRPKQSEPESKLSEADDSALNFNSRKWIQKWVFMEVKSHEFTNKPEYFSDEHASTASWNRQDVVWIT